jgi:hypothetical protein
LPLKENKIVGFEQHGFVVLNYVGDQATGVCPFCFDSKHFFINEKTFLWDCKRCGRAGNYEQFLEQRSAQYEKDFSGKVASDLAINRHLKPQTLKAWEVGWSGNFYTIPLNGNPNRIYKDLRRFHIGKKCISTMGSSLCFACPKELYMSDRIWLCEGEWDGMAWWEVLQALNIKEDVYSVPGAAVFPAVYQELFFGKEVINLYDNDDPGRRGAFKAWQKLSGVSRVNKFLHWTPEFSEGFDVRDFYLQLNRDFKKVFAGINAMLKNEPASIEEISGVPKEERAQQIKLTGPGIPAEKVFEKFRKWLFIENGEALEILFGSVFANRIDGDPLWLFLVAPPGGMKTELLLSLSDAPLITTTTSLTPHALISGAVITGGSDPSLIPKLNNKVLVVKDFTTILSMNSLQRDEIFGVLRDAYDGKTEKQFGNGVVRRYESKFGILAGVTPAIESLYAINSSLGERFLKYHIQGSKREAGVREAILRALHNIKQNEQMRKELSAIGKEVLSKPISSVPEISEELLNKIVELARWTAAMRGVVSRERYSGRINFKPTIEVGTRLAKQLCKLAYGVAFFKGEAEVSEATYNLIVKVAQDTAPDRVEEIIKHLFISEKEMSTADISILSKFPLETTRFVLQDLNMLDIVSKSGMNWNLSQKTRELMLGLNLYWREKKWKK